MRHILYTIIALIFLPLFSFAQLEDHGIPRHNCDAHPTEADIAEELALYPDGFQFEDEHLGDGTEKATFTRWLDVKFIIVQKNDGSGGINRATIDSWINTFNRKISVVQNGNTYNVKMRLCGNAKRLNSNRFYNLGPNEESDLRDTYFKRQVLNIYVVNEVTRQTSSGSRYNVCGYAYYPPSNTRGENFLVVDKECGVTTFVHEVGHNLGLYHTHETRFGAENVARLGGQKNCTSAGDRFCDTPADPNLSGRVFAVDCSYGGTPVDRFGRAYAPKTNNYMSYSVRDCRKRLTPQQKLKAYSLATRYKQQGNGCTTPNIPQFLSNDEVGETGQVAAGDIMWSDLDFQVTVAPNPVKEQLGLIGEFSGLHVQENLTLTIMDLTGRVIKNISIDEMHEFEKLDIPVSDLSPGLYVARLSNDIMQESVRFVKE